jgi:hypothetical protein
MNLEQLPVSARLLGQGSSLSSLRLRFRRCMTLIVATLVATLATEWLGLGLLVRVRAKASSFAPEVLCSRPFPCFSD